MKNSVRIEIEYKSGSREVRSIENDRWPEWRAALEECQKRGSVKAFSKTDLTTSTSKRSAT